MQQTFSHLEKDYHFDRVPSSGNKSLRAWSAADELLLQYAAEEHKSSHGIILCNDRFGFLATLLHQRSPQTIIHLKSQQASLHLNLKENDISKGQVQEILADAPPRDADLVLVHCPKSIDLLDRFLQQTKDHLKPGGTVLIGFMTKYFGKGFLTLCEKHFEEVEQTRAVKKARLFICRKPKATPPKPLITAGEFQQHQGVFAASGIDLATRFLLETMDLQRDGETILDLGCGNGIIGATIASKSKDTHVHYMDDDYLAVASAKLNTNQKNSSYHWDFQLNSFPENSFDLVITNPPFHFENEIDISIPIGLFDQALRCLKPEGSLIIVANKHLNYRTHLEKKYARVALLGEDGRFEILQCLNG